MIYYLEHDANGTIYHINNDPLATIVPLVNCVELKKADGTLIQLEEPVGIDQATFDTLMAEGLGSYTYDAATRTIVKKVTAPENA